MTNRPGLGAVIAAVLLSGAADAKPRAPYPDHAGAPDPSRGERLDGRASPKDPKRFSLFVPRALLFVPRVVALSVLTPVNELVRSDEETGFTKTMHRWFTTEDDKIGVRPVFGYESGFAPGAGLRVFDRRTLGEGTEMGASFLFSAVDDLKLDGEVRALPGDFLHLHASWEREPSEIFAGIDGMTRDELAADGRHISRYSSRTIQAGVNIGDRKGVGQWQLALDGVTADYGSGSPRSSDPSIDEVFCADPAAGCMGVDPTLVPGFDRGLSLLRLRGTVGFDTRGRERFANGVSLHLDGHLGEGVGDDPSRHASVRAESRMSVAIREREFVLRLRGGMIEGLAGAEVPFEELLTPGGNDGLRALSDGRLRGHSELLGTLEYSWLLGARYDATLFADYGGAFSERFENFSFDRMIPGAGISLRKYRLVRYDYHTARSQSGLTMAWAPQEGFRLSFVFVE